MQHFFVYYILTNCRANAYSSKHFAAINNQTFTLLENTIESVLILESFEMLQLF